VTNPDLGPGESIPTSLEPGRRGPIQRLVEASVGQPLLVAVLVLAIIGTGIFSLQRLPVDAYPDVSPPSVELTAQWPGHAAEEVERLITVPIETELNGLPSLVVMRSVSLYGISNVRVTFTDGTDIYFARQQVFERLPGASLPEGVETDVEAPFSPSGLVYRYVVQSPDRSPMDLHVLQDWVLDKAYRAVPGVADVASLGGETMQYQVNVDPTRLAGAGLSISDVSSALTANNSNGGGGFYSEGGQFFYVRGLGRVRGGYRWALAGCYRRYHPRRRRRSLGQPFRGYPEWRLDRLVAGHRRSWIPARNARSDVLPGRATRQLFGAGQTPAHDAHAVASPARRAAVARVWHSRW